MRTKLLIFATLFALLTSPALAQDQANVSETPEVSPGLVGSGSPIYGLEVAIDNAAMRIGMKKAGNVAQERAAEARKASRNNNSKGVQRAAQALEKTANRAHEQDEEGINRAIKIMQETIENSPNEQARQGMQTALDNMRQAQQQREQRRETDQQPNQSNDNQNRGNQTQQQQNDRDQAPEQERDNTTSGNQQESGDATQSNAQNQP